MDHLVPESWKPLMSDKTTAPEIKHDLTARAVGVTPDELTLIKTTVAVGATDAELKLFLYDCARQGVHPLDRLIHFTKRGGKYTPITSIDFMRQRAAESGEYAGSDDAVFGDTEGLPEKPLTATVTVYRLVQGHICKFTASARWSEYKPEQNDFMWKRMPFTMLAKCFDEETEILTERGFQLFRDLSAKVLQVTTTGLEAVDAHAFAQPYTGPMVCVDGDMLNFCVTPNHDMVTTVGTVEAGALYETARCRTVWQIPLTCQNDVPDWSQMSDDDLRLAGAIAADGWYANRAFYVSVSRPWKVAALSALAPTDVNIVHSRGAIATTATRTITTNFDKTRYTFDPYRVSPLIGTDKVFAMPLLAQLSQRQVRLLLDTWQAFDGNTNKKTGVRRLYTSRLDHLRAIEVLACRAGYSVNVPRPRTSDISDRPNYCVTISEPAPISVVRPGRKQPGVFLTENVSGRVWCVTVPSGQIIVRRRGFSMICGNCAEALALRKGFPRQLAGLYAKEEMDQASVEPKTERPKLQTAKAVLTTPIQPAAAPGSAVLTPSVPNGGDSGHSGDGPVNPYTGEVYPPLPVDEGWQYVYHYDRDEHGWHRGLLSPDAAQFAAGSRGVEVKTKFKNGERLKEAYDNKIPVKITQDSKGYLKTIQLQTDEELAF